MNVALHLDRNARLFGDVPAVSLGGHTVLTYAQLAARATRLAGGLLAQGCQPGDRVGIAMQNVPDYLTAIYAIWWAGLAAVPMNAKLHEKEFAVILANCRPRLVFTTPDLTQTLSRAGEAAQAPTRIVELGDSVFQRMLLADPVACARVLPEEIAWLFYTSGTTGVPKGAMLMHRNLHAMTLGYLTEIDPVLGQAREQILHAAPLSHGSGLYMLPHILMASTQILPESGKFDPAEIFALFGDPGRRIAMFAAPTMVKRLTAHGAAHGCEAPGLKTIIYGGAPMYLADCKAALDLLGPKLAQLYGQGESPMTISALSSRHYADRDHPRWEARLASAGYPFSICDVRIADEEGNPLPEGETGEILVRGDSVMAGYLDMPEATAKALRDGWLFTGDMGVLDPDGLLTLKDRSKDLIISGGSNIYPREVEEVLLTHPAVREVSVVGRPDPDWGEVVVAFVAAEPGFADTAALDALCLASIARFKRPKEYRFVEALPKNNYGKIEKKTLRTLL